MHTAAEGDYLRITDLIKSPCCAGLRLTEVIINVVNHDRILVSGWIGVASIKWVGRVEVSEQALYSPWNSDAAAHALVVTGARQPRSWRLLPPASGSGGGRC